MISLKIHPLIGDSVILKDLTYGKIINIVGDQVQLVKINKHQEILFNNNDKPIIETCDINILEPHLRLYQTLSIDENTLSPHNTLCLIIELSPIKLRYSIDNIGNISEFYESDFEAKELFIIPSHSKFRNFFLDNPELPKSVDLSKFYKLRMRLDNQITTYYEPRE